MQKLFLLLLFIAFLSMHTQAEANQRCLVLAQEIRKAHYLFFGLDFPYWYSIGQAEKESLCRHSILSSDGIGSEGFAQITWDWWKNRLAKVGIPEIKSIPNHAKAQAYINRYEYDRTRCRKLFEMYQRYNGGDLVTRELAKANSCKWEDGYRTCRRKDVCVWKTKNGCRQWRNACDINYEYSLKIFKLAQKYRTNTDSDKYPFF